MVNAGQLIDIALDVLNLLQRSGVEDIAVLDLHHDGEGLGTAVLMPFFVELDVVMVAREEVVKFSRDGDLGTVVAEDRTDREQDKSYNCPEADDEIADPQRRQLY